MTLIERIQEFITAIGDVLKAKADLVDGVVPMEQLPDATLSEDQFETLPSGKIGIKTSYLQSLGLGGTPAIPVITKQPQSQNLTVGDTLTLEVDFSGIGILTWEGSTDGGNTFPYENGHDKVITITNVQLTDKGHYRVRINYSGGVLHSDVAAITVNEATVEEPGSIQPVTAWHGLVNGVALNENSFSFTTPAGAYGYTFADKKIPSGADAYVQFDGLIPTQPSIATAILSLTSTMDATHGHDAGINAWYTNSNKIVSRIAGEWNDSAWTAGTGQQVNGTVADTKIRLRVDATTAYIESSINGGVDWLLVRSGVRPAGDLFLRVFVQVGETNTVINNIQGSGLV
jgi:hypothetical protein